jgi:hypothetical protein
MTKDVTLNANVEKRQHKVASLVSRFCRQKKFVPAQTYGDVYANKVTELSGDKVELDTTEQALVALRRCKAISGRRMVNLIGRHQREIRG